MVQLRVSALDNDHLQVVHEILFKQLYKTYMGCLYGVGRDTRSRAHFTPSLPHVKKTMYVLYNCLTLNPLTWKIW